MLITPDGRNNLEYKHPRLPRMMYTCVDYHNYRFPVTYISKYSKDAIVKWVYIGVLWCLRAIAHFLCKRMSADVMSKGNLLLTIPQVNNDLLRKAHTLT